MKPILVLDTNVILDVLVFNDPRAHVIRIALEDQRVDALRSTATLIELTDVIQRPVFALSKPAQESLISRWQAWSRPLHDGEIRKAPIQCRDPDDQMFIDIAYSCRPALLLSKDLRVLELQDRALKERIQISSDYDCLSTVLLQ